MVDASHHNVIENCYVYANTAGSEDPIVFEESDETIGDTMGDNNIIRNSIFSGGGGSIAFASDNGSATSTGNKIYNCTFYGAYYLYKYYNNNTGTYPTINLTHSTFDIKNCIIHSLTSLKTVGSGITETDPTLTYNDFYNCGASLDAFVGANSNIDVNPSWDGVANETEFNPTNVALNAADPLSGVEYDYDNTERDTTPTIGAKEI